MKRPFGKNTNTTSSFSTRYLSDYEVNFRVCFPNDYCVSSVIRYNTSQHTSKRIEVAIFADDLMLSNVVSENDDLIQVNSTEYAAILNLVSSFKPYDRNDDMDKYIQKIRNLLGINEEKLEETDYEGYLDY